MAYIVDENGNYKRTVTCQHCWSTGHNKSSCSKRKTDLKENIERYEKELDEDNFSEPWYKENTKRYLERAKEDLSKMLNKGKNRKCGFCGIDGHTRPSCGERKQATEKATGATINLRKKAAQKMATAGFGPGCLVKASVYGHNDPILAVVTNIHFSRVLPSHQVKKDGYFSTVDAVEVRFVTPVKDDWSDHLQRVANVDIPLEYFNIDDLQKEEWYSNPHTRTCDIVSSVQIEAGQLLPSECIDKKAVKQHVLNAVVDPR